MIPQPGQVDTSKLCLANLQYMINTSMFEGGVCNKKNTSILYTDGWIHGHSDKQAG